MTYKGIVKGNTIVLSQPVKLAEGTEVEIIPINLSDPVCGTWHDEGNIETYIQSESSLEKEWLSPVEDEAWKDL